MAFDQAKLLARAKRALGRITPTEAVEKVRSIVGPRIIPIGEGDAQAAMEALLQGRIPTPAQISALEMVIRLMRPVVQTANGELGDLPETDKKDLRPEKLKSDWSGFRQRIMRFLG